MTGRSRPDAWIEGCRAAQARLANLATLLSDEDARRPSLLDGWTIGHLLTHLARNADSHTGMVVAARHGQVVPQYAGGPEERARAIEAGWNRPASALADDLREAQARLAAAWAALDAESWATGCGLRRQGPTTLADLVFYRWQEVEIHLADLGLADVGGPTWDDLSDGYVDLEWANTLNALPPRLPAGISLLLVPGDRPSRAVGPGSERQVVRAPTRRILRWLLGRGGERSWPALGPWFY
jgi:maleylpyruvate isomerase